MPEGHTIHRLARDLNRSFRAKPIEASSPQGRFTAGAERLDGQQCSRFRAFGKHLVGLFASGDVLHVHLGLIGKFNETTGDPVGAVRLRLSYEDSQWDLRGPMICTVGPPELADQVADSVGPDPLDRKAKVADFVAAMQRKRVAIGAALLDQAAIAGIGNVYRAELLFLVGVDPLTPTDQLTEDQLRQIWDLAVAQLERGEKLNRIVTVEAKELGYRSPRSVPDDDRLFVYKRDGMPCRVCDSEIELLDIANRKMWKCPTCQ